MAACFTRVFLAVLLSPALAWSFTPIASNSITSIGNGIRVKLPPSPTSSRIVMKSEASDTVDTVLERTDKWVLKRGVRIVNHIPALASIAYFGLISMASMMGMGANPPMATLASVLTQRVGPTSNALFSNFFPTFVTPPSFIFLIWPFISVLQLVTVTVSALLPGAEPVLSQDDLSALSVANLAATGWLLVSSRASAVSLPLGSFLVLPFVPILSGYPLRKNKVDDATITTPTLKNFVFQVYSSFTTIAAFLALAVELQHGGRIPFFKGKAELCASVFLALYAATVTLPRRGITKKVINAGAILGILWKRIAEYVVTGGLVRLPLSISFLGTLAVACAAVQKLFKEEA